ncbi:MAG: MerR family DNA-binding transcriptional regulator [Leifsonia sp.]|uniref:MerR family DNA-binding transcriptional regulator n=1 Tax=Leifsonia sp. TaxID=1870902 RepID=UPI003F7DAB4F
MLKIGEFAGLTGLSVKALRHYDEIGALVPADVDDRSAYRLYGESQVRAGVVIRALRDAEVPLPAVSAAISGGEAAQALETHRVRVLEQREREDPRSSRPDPPHTHLQLKSPKRRRCWTVRMRPVLKTYAIRCCY